MRLFFLACLVSNLGNLTVYCQNIYYPPKPEQISLIEYNSGKNILTESYDQMRRAKDGIVAIDYWNFAIAYMRMGQSIDSVYYLLEMSKVVEEGSFCELTNAYISYHKGLDNSAFYKALGSRFKTLINSCGKYKKDFNTDDFNVDEYIKVNNYKRELIVELDKMYKLDQLHRSPFDSTLQNPLDRENSKTIDRIVQKYGYPGKSIVGDQYASVAWVIIQHSDLERQEKYLDIIHKAVLNNELSIIPLKMLIDRIYFKKIGTQIFGSQLGVSFSNDEIISRVKAKYGLN